MNENSQNTTDGIKRRSVVKAAAWAAPVIATAVAVPAMAATGEPTEEATYVYLGGDSGAPAGIWNGAQAQGRVVEDGQLVPGYLPAGTTITLTPSPAGATISVRNMLGVSGVENPDGSWTLTVLADSGQVSWQHTLSVAGTILGSTSLTGSGEWTFV